MFLTDDGGHFVRKVTLDGKVLLELGVPGKPAPFMSGEPFHRCTHTALSPQGQIYVSDGYGNSRVHKYTPDGKLVLSWGEPGTGEGEFNIVHNICCDADGWVYVADRENHRVQVFDGNGKYATQWQNLHRPCGLCMPYGHQPIFYVGEVGPAAAVSRDIPNLGPRVSIVDHQGKLIGRFGETPAGIELGKFLAPHGLAVDSRGDVYVGEVSWTADLSRHAATRSHPLAAEVRKARMRAERLTGDNYARVWYDQQGAADEVLVCGELPTPNAGYGEVRVKLEASGVNPSDTYRRRGPPTMEYPRVITNSDGAGVIDQLGPGLDQQRLGKRVWLYNGQRNGRWMGTAAEYIALSVDLITELPDHVSCAEGATLGVPAMTAHRAVFVAGPVQGKTLLVTGGAGAVGHYAVQLANWAGATVIATVSSSEKADRARAGGAAHVINYRSEDVAARVLDITGGVGVDHIAEVDFGGNLAATLRCLRVNGSIMIYASNGDREPKLPVRDLMQKNLAVYAMSLAGVPYSDRKRAQADIAASTATPGRILSVAARFPLYETAAAHKAVEAGGKIGTVIVEPQR